MAQDYRELATTLRGRIDAGEFRQTGKLPTEDQLIEEYQTTRYRVRNAIAVLAEAGDVFPLKLVTANALCSRSFSCKGRSYFCHKIGRASCRERV